MTPSRASKLAFDLSRRRAIFVTSTSITVVNCALTCRDSTMRAAITLRRRDIVTVVPRRGDTAIVGANVRGAELTGAAATGADFLGAASSTSSRRIRPPMPVPLTEARFTPSSEANLRTRGVT